MDFKSYQPLYKESYSRIKEMFKKKHEPKAHAEEDASKDPQGFMDKMKNTDIKKVKGIAF